MTIRMALIVLFVFLACSASAAQPGIESDSEIISHLLQGDSQGREPANILKQQQTCVPDVNTVLREMSAQLAELKVEMKHLQKENQVQAAKVRELELQKSELEKLKQQYQAQAGELSFIKSRANVTENQVDALRREGEVKQVAFSASLLASGSGTTGPFNAHTPLVFKYVVTNIGNAYNPDTGLFIAPVRGAYHFDFSVGAHGHASHFSGVALVKNGQHIFVAHEHQPSHYGSASNDATLLLEVGDVVHLRLQSNGQIYDSENHHSTFSGHLLFTM